MTWRQGFSALAVVGWALAPWLPTPLLFVALGAIAFPVLHEHPRWIPVAALLAGFSQLAWIPPALALSGKSELIPLYLLLGLWQSSALLFALLLAKALSRLHPSPLACGMAWGAAQGFADLGVPLPALHAALAAEQTWVLWPAALGGPALVTAMIAGWGAWCWTQPKRALPAAVLHLLVGAALSNLPPTGAPLQAAVIQPDLHALDSRPSLAGSRLDRLVELMKTEADLYALPETAWPVDPGSTPGQRQRDFLHAVGNRVIVTGAVVDGATNSLISTPELDRIDKAVLVPGWERSLFGIGQNQFRAGDGDAVLSVGGLRVGGLICYEDVVWRRVQRAASASLLVAATNDSWNGPGAGSRLHLAHTRLVAVSTGLWVLRPAMNGPSAILSPWGQAVWMAPWVDSGPGQIGVATVWVGPSMRPGRASLLWEALFALLALGLWRPE